MRRQQHRRLFTFQPVRHVKFRWLNYQREKLQSQRDKKHLNLLIEKCILAVEPKIKFVPHYQKKLRMGILHLDSYVQQMTEQLYRYHPEHKLTDSIFSSLFIGRENAEVFVTKQPLVVELKKHNGLFEPQIYFGLLRCRIEEKVVFGAELQNDKVVQDAKKIQFTVQGRSVVACTLSSIGNKRALHDLLYQYLFTVIKGKIFPDIALGYQKKNRLIDQEKQGRTTLSPTQVLMQLVEILQAPNLLMSVTDKDYKLGKYGEIIHQPIATDNTLNHLHISLLNCDKHRDELLMPFRYISAESSNQ